MYADFKISTAVKYWYLFIHLLSNKRLNFF